MQSFLKLLLAMNRPKRILEVGTAVGFSSILMAEYAPKDCKIVTIENYEKRIPIARANFVRAGKEKQIALLEGDAADVLKTLNEPFDLIFMDAAKGQYIHFMPDILRLLKTGGTLVSDNVLQDGDIIESHYAVTRRNRTIYKRLVYRPHSKHGCLHPMGRCLRQVLLSGGPATAMGSHRLPECRKYGLRTS